LAREWAREFIVMEIDSIEDHRLPRASKDHRIWLFVLG
jgi:hypothetical protein